MGGGLMQLVAYGAQDIYLTGNPQITFFKVVYRRHTNFSMEAIEQTFDGNVDFGGEVVATISRNGDLVGRMYLEHSFHLDHGPGSGHSSSPSDGVPGIRERVGDALIKECSLEIGGQLIDRHTGLWNRVYSDLNEFNPTGHFGADISSRSESVLAAKGAGTLYQLMTGNCHGFNANKAGQGALFGAGEGNQGQVVNGFTYRDIHGADFIHGRVYIPFNFWFCKNPGLALPLIALQYHEVKINLKIEHEGRLIYAVNDVPSTSENCGTVYAYSRHANHSHDFKLWVDYIYLDTDERRRFAQVSHEYLIEQLQYQTNNLTTPNSDIDLYFNHPVKEIIWCSKSIGTEGRNRTGGDVGNLVGNGMSAREDPSSGEVSLDQMGGKWNLKLNGHDRFEKRNTKYFTRTQVWQHHTGYGALPTVGIYSADWKNLSPSAPVLVSTNTGNKVDLVPGTIGNDSIAVYSFSLKPEEHQPSGTCNFSRIDSAQLIGENLQIANATTNNHLLKTLDNDENKIELTIFAVNYNVLRIMSGMGGLAYSN